MAQMAAQVLILAAMTTGAGVVAQCTPQWLPGPGLPDVDHIAQTSTLWDPDGPGPLSAALMIGGRFSFAGQSPARNIALWDGSSWSPMGGGLPHDSSSLGVCALAQHGGMLIAGGSFELTPGSPGQGIAAWNGSAWAPLGGGGGGIVGWVSSLAVYGDDLIAAGYFAAADSTPVSNIARWNGASWHTLSAGLAGGAVYALAVHDGLLVASGTFTSAGGQPAPGVASWDGSSWAALPALGAAPGAWAGSLLSFGGDLYAAVTFPSGASPVAPPYVLRLEGGGWSAVGGDVNGWVSALGVHEGELIASGVFTRAGGVDVEHLAAWDGTNWSVAADGRGRPALAIQSWGDRLILLGGGGGMPNGLPGEGVSVWDGTTWSGLRPGFDGWVSALAVYAGDLIAGGSFDTAPGIEARGIARWDGRNWHPLAGGLESSGHWQVRDLVTHAGRLVVVGSFDTAGAVPANNIAVWDGQAWEALGEGLSLIPLRAASWRNELYVCGHLQLAGGGISTLARWDGQEWNEPAPPLAGTVNDVAVHDGRLIAVGMFRINSAAPWYRAAAWDGLSWEPLPGFYSGTAEVVASHRGELFVGGPLTTVGGQSADLFRRSGSGWQVVANTHGGYGTGAIRTLGPIGGDLLVAGDFEFINGLRADGLARWDGTMWTPIGAPAGTLAAAAYGTGIAIAGKFPQGPAGTSRFAILDCECYANCDNSPGPAMLNVADFTCFLTSFAAGDPYANCDQSTQPPTLNVADFTCYLQRFAAGCQ